MAKVPVMDQLDDVFLQLYIVNNKSDSGCEKMI